MHFQFRTCLDGTVTCSSKCSWGAETASGDWEPESTPRNIRGSTVPKKMGGPRSDPPTRTLANPSRLAMPSRSRLGWGKCQGESANGLQVEWSHVAMVTGRQGGGTISYCFWFSTVLVPFVRAISVPPSTSLAALPKCGGLFNCRKGELPAQLSISCLWTERSTHCWSFYLVPSNQLTSSLTWLIWLIFFAKDNTQTIHGTSLRLSGTKLTLLVSDLFKV